VSEEAKVEEVGNNSPEFFWWRKLRGFLFAAQWEIGVAE